MRTRNNRADGELTRQRILLAAGEMFARTGLAETTSKAIAEKAGVDLALINYHFGSRSGLYQAVLIEAHRHVFSVETLSALVESKMPASDKLRQLIAHLIDLATRKGGGWELKVFGGEILSPSSHFQVMFDKESTPKIALVSRIIQEITGIPEEDPALVRCLVSALAPCLLLLISGRTPHGPINTIRQMDSDTLLDHLHGFAMAGLLACAAKPPRSPKERPPSGARPLLKS